MHEDSSKRNDNCTDLLTTNRQTTAWSFLCSSLSLPLSYDHWATTSFHNYFTSRTECLSCGRNALSTVCTCTRDATRGHYTCQNSGTFQNILLFMYLYSKLSLYQSVGSYNCFIELLLFSDSSHVLCQLHDLTLLTSVAHPANDRNYLLLMCHLPNCWML